MTLLSAIICRIGGHKPYEHPIVVWHRNQSDDHLDGQVMVVKRCTRCDVELGRRPMLASEETIEA